MHCKNKFIESNALDSALLKSDLLSTYPTEHVFQKHIIDSSSYYFSQKLHNIDLEYMLRGELASSLKVDINDLIIVGSAKLGYSIKTEELRTFDAQFRTTSMNKDKSDIDIAIVNKRLFENISKEIFDLSNHFNREWIEAKWVVNPYTNGKRRNLFSKYTTYLAKGWLRPDFFPDLYLNDASWREVCSTWRTKLEYRKISLGFYSDWYYFKCYQIDQLKVLESKFRNLT